MSDYSVFESDEAAQAEPRLAARTAARKLEAAIDTVRSQFGRFLMGATGIDEFEDRWHYSKADIRKTIEPLVFPNTGTMRRVQNAMKADWKLAHPYKLAGNPHTPGSRQWFDWEYDLQDGKKPEGSGPHAGSPVGPIPLRGPLTPEQEAWLKGRRGGLHQALSHDEAGFGSMPTGDGPPRNLDTDETYHPSSGNLIPEGNFEGYKDSVDQNGPEKVQRDFTPGGDSGTNRAARRHVARDPRNYDMVGHEYTNINDPQGSPVIMEDEGDHEGVHNYYRDLMEEPPIGYPRRERSIFEDEKPLVKPDYEGPGDLGSFVEDTDHVLARREAAALVADIYTDFARANGLRVASLDTLDHYASTGIAESDYRLLESMIVRAAAAEDEESEEEPDEDDEDGEDDHEEPDADNAGGPSDGDEDNEDEDDEESESDSDDDGDEDYDFGGDDDESGDEGGESAGGEQFTVPEQAPDLDPQMLNEIPHDDPQGSAPVPPEVVDSLLGLPAGTIEQLLLQEVQQGQGGSDGFGGAPEGGDDFGGEAPQGGGDDFFGQGGGDEEAPPHVAARQFWAAPDEAEGDLMARQRQQHQDAMDTKFGPAPTVKPNIRDLTTRAQNGDGEAYAQLKGLWKDRGWTAARRFWAADDDQPGGDSGGGEQQPPADPSAGGDPAAMGGAPMMPPPGSQSVAPPQPAMPLENQPAEDALLDTANQAIMQMIDRETAEYQQIIGPLSQALQAVQFAQQVEQSEHPMDVTPPQGTVNVDPSQAPGGAGNPQQQLARLMRRHAKEHGLMNQDGTCADCWWGSSDAAANNPEAFAEYQRGDGTMSYVDRLKHYHPNGSELGGIGRALGDMFRGGSREAKKVRVLKNAARLIAKTYGVNSGMLIEAMGRRQYEHVAEAFHILPPQALEDPYVRAAARHIAKMFAAENPMFNEQAFMNSAVGPASGSRLPFDPARAAGIRQASDPRDREWDAWASGRDRGRDEHGRNDIAEGLNDYYDESSNPAPMTVSDFVDQYGSGPIGYSSETGVQYPSRPWDEGSDHVELPSQQYATGIDADMLRRMKPHEYLSSRTAGENQKNTPTLDAFEWDNTQPNISDNMTINDLPKQQFKGLPKMKAYREADIGTKVQNWMKKQTEQGLNMGGDAMVHRYLNEHKQPASQRGMNEVHEALGITPEPPANNPAPKEVAVPKAKNPVTKKATWGEDWEPKQASFFTRKVPGWKWDDHLNGYISKEGRAFTCSCGQKVAAPSYKSCDCGKIWNVYAIGDTHHLASDTADMFIAREIPVRPGVVMANRKMAGQGGRGIAGDWMEFAGNGGVDLTDFRNRYNPSDEDMVRLQRYLDNKGLPKEKPRWNADPDEHLDPFDPRVIGASAQKSHRELLAEIDKLADWTKYDDDVDPAVEAYGKNKVPSTKVSQPPKDWAKRKPAGDPGKQGGTWTPPTIPRKKK